jgi:hypothetical protein
VPGNNPVSIRHPGKAEDTCAPGNPHFSCARNRQGDKCWTVPGLFAKMPGLDGFSISGFYCASTRGRHQDEPSKIVKTF